MKSRIKIELETAENFSLSSVMTLKRKAWNVSFLPGKIIINSRDDYEIPEHLGIERRKIDGVVNGITGHVRNVSYLALGIEIRWGMRWSYDDGRHSVDAAMDIYPSIHQFTVKKINFPNGVVMHSSGNVWLSLGQEMIKDVGRSRKKHLASLLNYWRRARELNDLGFHPESFLNYYKIIECFELLPSDDGESSRLLETYFTNEKSQARFKKEFKPSRQEDWESLKKKAKSIAEALVAANCQDGITQGIFVYLIKCIYMRHQWNVGHKLLRVNPYDTYDAIGQHSDEFDLVMLEIHNLEIITKHMILGYVKPSKYCLSFDGILANGLIKDMEQHI